MNGPTTFLMLAIVVTLLIMTIEVANLKMDRWKRERENRRWLDAQMHPANRMRREREEW